MALAFAQVGFRKAARLLYITLLFSGALVRARKLARADARSGEGLLGTSSYQVSEELRMEMGGEERDVSIVNGFYYVFGSVCI